LKEKRDRRATKRLNRDPIKRERDSRTERKTKRLITNISSSSRKIKTPISPTVSKKVANRLATLILAVQEEVRVVIIPDSPGRSALPVRKLTPNPTLRSSMRKIRTSLSP